MSHAEVAAMALSFAPLAVAVAALAISRRAHPAAVS
jgi:hypothetical protein